MVCGPDGVAVFDALHRRHKASDAILYAFDLLELDGADLRPLPLSDRKAKLARLLARKPAGIVLNEHTDEDGATVFRHACKLGLEGIVSCPIEWGNSIGAQFVRPERRQSSNRRDA